MGREIEIKWYEGKSLRSEKGKGISILGKLVAPPQKDSGSNRVIFVVEGLNSMIFVSKGNISIGERIDERTSLRIIPKSELREGLQETCLRLMFNSCE